MKKVILTVLAVPFIVAPAVILAQSGMKPSGATYISDEEVKAVNALPGVDRTIRVVDIGPENFAVGIIHRGATGAAARGAGAGAGAGAARGAGAALALAAGRLRERAEAQQQQPSRAASSRRLRSPEHRARLPTISRLRAI